MAVTGPWKLPGWDEELRAECDVVCGPSIDEAPSTALSEDELRVLCADADAILVSTRERVTPTVLDAAPRLRIIAKATIGIERIDVAAATERGVLVVNSPAPENIIGLAEATVGLIVALAKRLLDKEARLRAGGWRDASTDGFLLAGRTVGIIGLGRVGSAVAQRLLGWDLVLTGSDPYIPRRRFGDLGVQAKELGELLASADVVTIHVPLTAETEALIGEHELARMRSGSYLVNTSRGPVVDEQALAASLASGHLAGAALDVFTHEPLPAESLLRRLPRERLLLTPHSIGSSTASRTTGTKMAVHAIRTALQGRVPPNVINDSIVPDWLERWGSGEHGLREPTRTAEHGD